MTKAKGGQELKVGDTVTVTCVVKSIPAGGAEGAIGLETVESASPNGPGGTEIMNLKANQVRLVEPEPVAAAEEETAEGGAKHGAKKHK